MIGTIVVADLMQRTCSQVKKGRENQTKGEENTENSTPPTKVPTMANPRCKPTS